MFNKFVAVIIVAFAYCVGQLIAESCVSCSSKDDPNCAQHPQQIAPKQCSNHGPDNDCYMRVHDGLTIRGCTEEMDQGVRDNCKNDTAHCSICRNFDGNTGCNKQIFPENRIYCHICTGDLNSNCSKSIDVNPTVCPIYLFGDKCFIRKTSKGTERGCLSSSGTKCNNQSLCFTCDGSGCNNKDSNSTDIPLAPSSAAMWKFSTSFVTVLVAFALASLF